MRTFKLHLPAFLAIPLGIALAIALFSVAPSPSGGNLPDKVIKWQKGQRLSWKEFQGRPDRMTNMDAMTESGIVFNWSCDWRGFEMEVYAMFDPAKSWVKRSQATPYLLKHEQAHFDITEIHARKMRKRFEEVGNPCRLGRSGISRLAQQVYNESAEMQNRYDEETRHSKDEREQARWEKKIVQSLKALEPWAK